MFLRDLAALRCSKSTQGTTVHQTQPCWCSGHFLRRIPVYNRIYRLFYKMSYHMYVMLQQSGYYWSQRYQRCRPNQELPQSGTFSWEVGLRVIVSVPSPDDRRSRPSFNIVHVLLCSSCAANWLNIPITLYVWYHQNMMGRLRSRHA